MFTFSDRISQYEAGLLTYDELSYYAVIEKQALTNFLPSAKLLGTTRLVKVMIKVTEEYIK